MKIIAFTRGGSPEFGTIAGDQVRPFPGAPSAVDLAMNPEAYAAGNAIALCDIELLPPVPRPGKIVCIGLNYRKHAEEGGNAIPDYPAVFLRGATSLAAPGGALAFPACSDKLDWEAELAIVIGRTASGAISDPLSHVAGYACFNDGTVRDYQRKSTQWTVGKNFDRTGGFGPALVTADELPAGAAGLRISTRVNGDLMQDSDTGDMIFDAATLIRLLAEAMTLEPGDVIATGTPAGVGYARNPPVFLRPGDLCEVEIEGIGILSNIVAERR